jgi:GMP synthase (glutamine-hydrolysing)
MTDRVIILDFGSQYTQLIARRLRELSVFCEIYPFNKYPDDHQNIRAVVLSGSPFSVLDENALKLDLSAFVGKVPVLGVCYGAQLLSHEMGGEVSKSSKREYGKANLLHSQTDRIFKNVDQGCQVWMSHSDTISEVPEGFEVIGKTHDIPVAAYRSKDGFYEHPIYCFQFHPEVAHSLQGKEILDNWLSIAGVAREWTPKSFVVETVRTLKEKIGDKKVVMGLSGGVDSSVAGELLHQAIGDQLYCIFIDNGVLRKNEFHDVLESYQDMGLNIKGVDASDKFLDALEGVSDPEAKRKVIGKTFIEIFDEEAHKIENVTYLGQGTIYPDVIESVSVHGPSVTIKSHHNVGGLPEKLHLKIVEPLRMLFKDEVRKVGRELGIPAHLINRHPFPGPGLGIRILGEVTREKVKLCQEADDIYIKNLIDSGWYDKVWQAGTILLPVQSVGVMGDERTYEYAVALRCVNSSDGMTAEWSRLPHELLAKISSEIINNVKGINRVVYDISTKPPATIEWE